MSVREWALEAELDQWKSRESAAFIDGIRVRMENAHLVARIAHLDGEVASLRAELARKENP